ncbi:MAG: hypothetical protein ABI311_00845 [Gemmatimonadaceae bacterium]
MTLLNAVQIAYFHHEIDAFVVLNATAAAALAIVVIRGAIRMRRNEDAASRGSNVVGVVGGLAAVTEGLRRLHSADFTFGHKHFALGVTTVLTGLLTVTMALLAGRLQKRRMLAITDGGIHMRFNQFRRFNIPWSDVAELQLGKGRVRLVSRTGKVRAVPLTRLLNRDEVRDALTDAAVARGIPIK